MIFLRLAAAWNFEPSSAHQPRRKQSGVPAKDHEGPTGSHNRRTVVAAEVGDRLEVRSKAAKQPHRLHVASAFPLQASRRPDFVEIAPDVELEQIARIVRWASRRRRNGTPETEAGHIEPADKGVDHPHRRFHRDIVVHDSRQQHRLTTILANHVSHENGRTPQDAAIIPDLLTQFSHGLSPAGAFQLPLPPEGRRYLLKPRHVPRWLGL
jgi:hypothetical protein